MNKRKIVLLFTMSTMQFILCTRKQTGVVSRKLNAREFRADRRKTIKAPTGNVANIILAISEKLGINPWAISLRKESRVILDLSTKIDPKTELYMSLNDPRSFINWILHDSKKDQFDRYFEMLIEIKDKQQDNSLLGVTVQVYYYQDEDDAYSLVGPKYYTEFPASITELSVFKLLPIDQTNKFFSPFNQFINNINNDMELDAGSIKEILVQSRVFYRENSLGHNIMKFISKGFTVQSGSKITPKYTFFIDEKGANTADQTQLEISGDLSKAAEFIEILMGSYPTK